MVQEEVPAASLESGANYPEQEKTFRFVSARCRAGASAFRGTAAASSCPARILPVWGEFLKRGEKGEEKKELDRGLHIFSSIACLVQSRVKARFFRDGERGMCGNHHDSNKKRENFWRDDDAAPM